MTFKILTCKTVVQLNDLHCACKLTERGASAPCDITEGRIPVLRVLARAKQVKDGLFSLPAEFADSLEKQKSDFLHNMGPLIMKPARSNNRRASVGRHGEV